MKRVLVVTYFFAQTEVIGAIRMQGLAKYLPLHGWRPTILTVNGGTPPNLETEIVATPTRDIVGEWKKKFGIRADTSLKQQQGWKPYGVRRSLASAVISLWEEVFAYPDPYKGWYAYALEHGRKIMSSQKFDALISCSSPVTSHLVARQMKEEFCVPWIADLRDLWTQHHLYGYSPFRRIVERNLETRTLSFADALTTVSKPLANRLGELHRGKQIEVITNAFDPSQENPGVTPSKRFSIVYTGFITKGKQDIDTFLKAVGEFISDQPLSTTDLAVDFYGANDGWLAEEINRHSLQRIAKVHGSVKREIAIAEQREAQVLLLLTWNDSRERGIFTGKLFDYLSAKRPIISIGPMGTVVDQLLDTTKAGVQVSTVEQTKAHLTFMYERFVENGVVPYQGISSEIAKYNQVEMARKFAFLLDEVTNGQ